MSLKYSKTFLLLLYFSSISILISINKFDFPHSLWTDFIWSFDGLSTQVQVQAIMEAGPFSSTDHLGYPAGYSHWTVPQFGLLHAINIWIFATIFDFSAYGLITIYGLIVLTLNGLSVYFLSFKISNLKYFAIVMGTVFMILPYSLNQLARPHVMSLYFFPALLYFIINQSKKIKLHRGAYIVLIITFLSISVFWSFAMVFILLPIILVFIFTKLLGLDFNYLHFKSVALCLSAVTIGLLVNLTFFQLNNNLRGEEDRFPWQSDIFAGKLSDLVIGSPFMNLIFPKLDSFQSGASFESNHLQLGIFYVILFFFALFSTFYSTIFEGSTFEKRITTTISLVTLLYFLIGGLSNLQAGLFNFFGIVTPMRSWARLSILIGICGLVLLIYFIKQCNQNHIFPLISIFASLVSVLDFMYTKPDFNPANNFSNQEEYKSLTYLNQNFKPCPVLQLPIDTYVLPQGWLDNAERYYWSQLKPFLMFPDFYWTGGTYTESAGWLTLKSINSTIEKEDLAKFSKSYCAVMFDKDFSKYQSDRQATLKDLTTGWPGLKVVDSIDPAYEDSRYSIYDLR